VCTLIIGFAVLGPGTVVLGANRDEDPLRPSDPPAVLIENPRVVGGRDLLARGTWLAIRENRAAVAMLNRRETDAGAGVERSSRRSRGLLTLDVAAVNPTDLGEIYHPTLADQALHDLRNRIAIDAYAPFTLAFLSTEGSWVLSHDPGQPPRMTTLAPGWHVLTHADLDDSTEPRTARLMSELQDFQPATAEDAEQGLIARLSQHASDGRPAVCIHEGRMVTVSSSVVVLGAGLERYRHVEGRPCENAAEDLSSLFRGAGVPA